MSIGKYFKNRRMHLGWRQGKVAALAGVAQSVVSCLENDVRLPSKEVLQRIAEVLGISMDELSIFEDVRPVVLVRLKNVLSRYRTHFRMKKGDIPFDVRVNQARQTLGSVVDDLMSQMRQHVESRAWKVVLNRWPFESGLEAILVIRLLLEGLVFTRVRLAMIGFPLPVVDPKTRVHTGNLSRWSLALVTDDIRCVLTPCVTVQMVPSTSKTGRRRLDLAVVAEVEGKRCAGNIETDGFGHTPEGDAAREEEVGLPTLRITPAELASGPILPRILAFLRALPQDKRSRAGVTGPWS